MKSELIHSLTGDFESLAHKTPEGVNFWLARDLQHLLGYAKWESFQKIIAKGKTACEVSVHLIANHFPDFRKMVHIGSGPDCVFEGGEAEVMDLLAQSA